MQPSSPPLLLLQLPLLRALDARSGRLLWETIVGEPDSSSTSPGRLFVTPHGTFVLAGTRVWLIDTATGRLIGGLALPFAPDTALFDGECFYFAAVPEAAAMRLDGTLLWKVGIEPGWFSGKLVCRDGAGNVVWEAATPTVMMGAAAGLALGELVSQPDDKGSR
jgi:hypothetical protein